jgi:hypothetical protein
MKITIDTDFKTIELHGEVSINELNETLVKLLADSVNEYKIIEPVKAEFLPIGWTTEPAQYPWTIHNPPYNPAKDWFVPRWSPPLFETTCQA